MNPFWGSLLINAKALKGHGFMRSRPETRLKAQQTSRGAVSCLHCTAIDHVQSCADVYLKIALRYGVEMMASSPILWPFDKVL